MPRNDLKAYETLTARIPQDLVDAARRYASLHRCTVSELIRDSLQMYLDTEGSDRASSSGQEGRHGQTEVLQEVLREVRHGQTEVLQEVRRGHVSLVQALAALPMRGQTVVRPGAADVEVLQGQTTEATPVPLVTDEGQTEGLQGQITRTTLEGQTEVRQDKTEVRPQENGPPYDTTRHHLGKLCPRKHEWERSGHSLRNADNQCLQCKAQAKREKRARQRQAAAL